MMFEFWRHIIHSTNNDVDENGV